MTRSLAVFSGVLLILTIPSLGFTQRDDSSQPYFDARKEPMEYVGPGREEPEPANLREVLIGYFGPVTPRIPKAVTSGAL